MVLSASTNVLVKLSRKLLRVSQRFLHAKITLPILRCIGPEGNGKTYTTGGKTYQLSCCLCNCGNDKWPSEPTKDPGTCATRCAAIE